MYTVIMVYPRLLTPLNCTLILNIHCWYPMYSLRLAPQCFAFTSSQCCLLCTSLAWSDQNAPWLRPLQLLLPTSSASATVPWLYLLQLAAPWLCPLQLLLPDCVRFSCCFSGASACYHTHAVHSTGYNKYKDRSSLLYSLPSNFPLLLHTDTHRHLKS